MTIDWFTVFVQAANFLLLVWILKRYLYAPILDAMDRRQKAVFAKLHAAEKREQLAEEKREELEEESRQLKQKERLILIEAHEKAEAEKNEIIKNVHHEMREKQSRFEVQLENEKKALSSAVRHLVAETLVKTARDALSELSSQDLEKNMITIFVEKIQSNQSVAVQEMQDAIKANGKVIFISAHSLSSDDKTTLEAGLNKKFSGINTIVYQENPDLVCGIEMMSGTILIRWGLDKYIENFGRALNDALDSVSV